MQRILREYSVAKALGVGIGLTVEVTDSSYNRPYAVTVEGNTSPIYCDHIETVFGMISLMTGLKSGAVTLPKGFLPKPKRSKK